MSVFCFSSLKGGVGKTTLSVNVGHAFAQRGCRTLLIDFDPAGHASRLFLKSSSKGGSDASGESFSNAIMPLAKVFLAKDDEIPRTGLAEFLAETAKECVRPLRNSFDILPSSSELRHFLWGRGARGFASYFPRVIKELRQSYDHIIMDTPPDFNVLTRNAIASSDMVVVPVDSSEMSINSLEELVRSAQHIRGPVWGIVRTMVSRAASRIQRLTNDTLHTRLSEAIGDGTSGDMSPDFGDTEYFLQVLRRREATASKSESEQINPLYLLHTLISRTELHNRFSFQSKTVFDGGAEAKVIAKQYLEVARELEEIIAYLEESEIGPSSTEFLDELTSSRAAAASYDSSDYEMSEFSMGR